MTHANTRTPEQQAELDALRAAKAKAAEAEFTLDEGKRSDESEEEFKYRMATAKVIEELPSGSRVVAAYLVGAMAAIGIGYGTSILIPMAISYFALSVAMSYVIWVIGVLIAMYVGGSIGGGLSGYIRDKGIDRDAAIVMSWLGFGKSKTA